MMATKSPQKQVVGQNSSSEDSSFEDSAPVVQPLHQGHIPKLWHKKILQEGSGNYASPTDNILSPCTKKLQAHKKRHYNKSKPQLLTRAFTSVATSKSDSPDSNQENTPPSSASSE